MHVSRKNRIAPENCYHRRLNEWTSQPASQPSEMWPIRNCFVVVDIAWRWPIDLQKWDMLLAMFHTTCLSCTFDCIGPVSRPFDCFQMSRARRPLMDGRTLMRGAREKHADKRRLLLAGWLAGHMDCCVVLKRQEKLSHPMNDSSSPPPSPQHHHHRKAQT